MEHLLIYDADTLASYVDSLNDTFVFDTESTGLLIDSTLHGISLYDGDHIPAFVFADTHLNSGVAISDMISILQPKLKAGKVICHNGKYDLYVACKEGFGEFDLAFDTYIASHMLDPDRLKKLEKLVESVFGEKKLTFEEVLGKKWDKITWKEDNVFELLGEYSCEDAYWEWQLYLVFKEQLEKAGSRMLKLFYESEIPLCYVLKDMYLRGVLIDVPLLNKMDAQILSHIEDIRERAYDQAECSFNLNSPKQRAEVLFDRLGLPSLKTTPKGERSTDKKVLEKLAAQGIPIAETLLDYSEVNKLQSGYTNAIPLLVSPDGRLRAEFNAAGTVTGRFSSSNPNLQNQPNNERFPIRNAFIFTEGYTGVAGDYSQIEYRFMGHCSKDKRIVDAFNAGFDFHKFVADTLHITRKQAKIVNFGIMYGMGYSSLSVFLKISEKQAKDIIANYHRQFPGYSRWVTEVEEYAMTYGYVRNIFGRIRKLPDAVGGRRDDRFFGALRQAVNTVVQGAAADFIKISMVKLQKEIRARKLPAYLLLQVHDELVGECMTSAPGRYYQVEEFADLMKDVMENSVKLSLPTPVDLKILPHSWGDMKNDNIHSVDRRIVENPLIYMM